MSLKCNNRIMQKMLQSKQIVFLKLIMWNIEKYFLSLYKIAKACFNSVETKTVRSGKHRY